MEEYRARGIEEMSWQDFVTVVDFYERSGFKRMTLLGGEPTLHSRFLDVLTFLGSRNFSVFVTTNGICPPSVVDSIAQMKFPDLKFGVNSTSYFAYSQEKRQKVDYFFKNIQAPVTICYTITEKDAQEKNIHPLLDRMLMIMRFSLIPHIQFQIAVPGEKNSGFVPFHQYGPTLELLQSWFKILQRNGVSYGLDCHCVPQCSISPPTGKNPFRTKCPSFMVDIGPGLDVWPCFPFSRQVFKLNQFQNFQEIYTCFSELGGNAELEYETECSECEGKLNNTCDGGCRGFQILRKKRREDRPFGPQGAVGDLEDREQTFP